MLTRTTTALLDGLSDPSNEAIWREFDARYRPVLVAFARRLGLGEEDAADVAQDALGRFVAAYRAGRFERGRGRLGSWLMGIARNCIVDQQRGRNIRRERRGLSALAEMPDGNVVTTAWHEECDREILRRAIAALSSETRLNAETITAFEMTVCRHLPPAEVAGQLGMTTNDVYLAKHRCLKRLRTIVAELTEAFHADA